MTPADPRLVELAAVAKVRPSHVYHTWHALAATPESFDPASFAEFCQLDVRHITAIVSALSDRNMLPKAEKPQRGSRLPEAFQIPPEWLQWACDKRYWTLADSRAEADLFVDYWRAKSGQEARKLDWFATWRNWVRNSRRGDGAKPAPISIAESDPEYHRRALDLYTRLGRASEAELHRKALEAMG